MVVPRAVAGPASRNCCFHFDTDMSDTPCLRAASAPEIFPDNTANTTRIVTSTGTFLGRDLPERPPNSGSRHGS